MSTPPTPNPSTAHDWVIPAELPLTGDQLSQVSSGTITLAASTQVTATGEAYCARCRRPYTPAAGPCSV